jgi:hypothetical protein
MLNTISSAILEDEYSSNIIFNTSFSQLDKMSELEIGVFIGIVYFLKNIIALTLLYK